MVKFSSPPLGAARLPIAIPPFRLRRNSRRQGQPKKRKV